MIQAHIHQSIIQLFSSLKIGNVQSPNPVRVYSTKPTVIQFLISRKYKTKIWGRGQVAQNKKTLMSYKKITVFCQLISLFMTDDGQFSFCEFVNTDYFIFDSRFHAASFIVHVRFLFTNTKVFKFKYQLK